MQTYLYIGRIINHDDAINDRMDGGKLVTSFARTISTVEEQFHMPYVICGGNYRGSPLEKDYADRNRMDELIRSADSDNGIIIGSTSDKDVCEPNVVRNGWVWALQVGMEECEVSQVYDMDTYNRNYDNNDDMESVKYSILDRRIGGVGITCIAILRQSGGYDILSHAVCSVRGTVIRLGLKPDVLFESKICSSSTSCAVLSAPHGIPTHPPRPPMDTLATIHTLCSDEIPLVTQLSSHNRLLGLQCGEMCTCGREMREREKAVVIRLAGRDVCLVYGTWKGFQSPSPGGYCICCTHLLNHICNCYIEKM